ITVSEPPIADPHDGWCGGCRRETCGYPIKKTPYWTFKNLAQIVKEEKYKYAKLVYNDEGMAIALNNPIIRAKEPQKTEDKVVLYPSF
ncbi:MAG: hypothetical protein KZQ70_12255, partial [gamma proteobacterium symbiont of Lucinoma myriamae]|nr:hypothetical protein [gamma proteobacterium symbiont of Lucinoma myriamae]MCU7817851.1 hypothetical protein [gamma proteobacterium symbiont of Lucinoma myriamae]MCU7833156.1 hypothetical protein [gamma proteobacterium symbiont of Lucinoma myriamae]